MRTVSMVGFRRDAEKIIRQIQKGERLVLTRGKPLALTEDVHFEQAGFIVLLHD